MGADLGEVGADGLVDRQDVRTDAGSDRGGVRAPTAKAWAWVGLLVAEVTGVHPASLPVQHDLLATEHLASVVQHPTLRGPGEPSGEREHSQPVEHLVTASYPCYPWFSLVRPLSRAASNASQWRAGCRKAGTRVVRHPRVAPPAFSTSRPAGPSARIHRSPPATPHHAGALAALPTLDRPPACPSRRRLASTPTW